MQIPRESWKPGAIIRRGPSLLQAASVIFFVLSVLPLLVLIYLGTFTRYLADDYSTSSILLNLGFWKAQAYWYLAWSGRYSFTFLVSLVEMAGVSIVPWLIASGILAWAAALFWTMRQVFKVFEIQISQTWTGALVNVIVFGTIKSFRQFGQVVFWQTGILTYLVSIVFITLVLGIFLVRIFASPGRKMKPLEMLFWSLVFFIGGGFSETWVVIQISILGLGILFSVFNNDLRRKAVLSVLVSGFLASCLSLLVMARAPGNLHRDAVTAELSFDLIWNAVWSAFRDVPVFLLEWVDGNTVIVLMVILAGLSIGFISEQALQNKQGLIKQGLLVCASAYILMWAGFAPNFAVMGVRPVERAIFMPMFLFLWAFALLWVFTGAELRSRSMPAGCLPGLIIFLCGWAVLLLLGPVRSSYSFFGMVPHLRLYAQYWDARDAGLRAAGLRGEEAVVVDSLRRNPDLRAIQTTFWIEGDLQDAPDHWVNQAAARYYGLSSITLRK